VLGFEFGGEAGLLEVGGNDDHAKKTIIAEKEERRRRVRRGEAGKGEPSAQGRRDKPAAT
jgi:hypothetical protein